MSCAGKGYGTNPQSDIHLVSQFHQGQAFGSEMMLRMSSRKCRKYGGFYPSFVPILSGLSVDASVQNVYERVYVTGSNFMPNGITFVKFGSFGFVPVTYYSAFNVSFIIPKEVLAGTYEVQMVNKYTNNFSPSVNPSYPANYNYSETSIPYVIRVQS